MDALESVDRLVIHHTERNNDSPLFVRFRHKYLRGWEDVGYHYLIGNTRPFSKNGGIYSGRSEEAVWAHTLGENRNSLGICLIGNFDKVLPSERQLESLLRLVEDKTSRYGVAVHNVLWHNEFVRATKTCPGKFVDMGYVRAVLSGGERFSFSQYVESVMEKTRARSEALSAR